MRAMLVLLAMANLFLVLVMLPLSEYARTAARHAKWVQTERSLVESGQLVFKPDGRTADPPHAVQYEFDAELMRDFAKPFTDDETEVRLAISIYLLAQTVVLLVLAWVAPPGKRVLRWRTPAAHAITHT